MDIQSASEALFQQRAREKEWESSPVGIPGIGRRGSIQLDFTSQFAAVGTVFSIWRNRRRKVSDFGRKYETLFGIVGELEISMPCHCHGSWAHPLVFVSFVFFFRDIFPIYDHPSSSDGAPVWEVEDEGDVKVFAAPMSHGIPCVGYVVEEQTRPGRLRDEFVKPIVERNFRALKEAGFGVPMKAMAVIKNLPVGSAFTFPDGTVVSQEEAVEPPRKGRKVVICGDTASCRGIAGLAQDADVLIHEATNSYLAGIDKDTDLKEVTRDAIFHGHSTPHMAGEFAKHVRAKRLVLNHFSARYKGDCSVDSLSIMMRIEGQALKASGLKETDVAAAWDLMVLPIPHK